MSDNSWRIKRYYRPRVLIDLAQLETSPLGPAIVCLTGPERSIVQNLLEYAHRRSTFVSEYHDDYYLAPSEEEWDEIDGLVAELEDKMSGCPEIVTLLEGILAATECTCERLTELPSESWPSGGKGEGQRDYDDYFSPVVYGSGDPPEEFPTWDDWKDYKCKAAQVIVDQVNALGERLEVVYTGGAAITFAVFQTLVVGTAIAPPVALVIAILAILVVSGTALAMLAFQQWCQTHKLGLVCAIHSAQTLPIARQNVLDYIDENWDLVMGQPFGEHLFSNAVLSKAFDGGLGVNGYSADYCLACAPPGERVDAWNFQGADWESPDWTLEGTAAWYLTSTGCRAPSYLGCAKASSTAWTVKVVPGEGPYTLDYKVYAYGANGDECEVRCYKGESAEGPWYAATDVWLPNFPNGDCGVRTEQRLAVNLAGYSHLKYNIGGIGLSTPNQILYFEVAWTLPT